MARGHPPPHCENTQVLREAITEDDDDDQAVSVYVLGRLINAFFFICYEMYLNYK